MTGPITLVARLAQLGFIAVTLALAGSSLGGCVDADVPTEAGRENTPVTGGAAGTQAAPATQVCSSNDDCPAGHACEPHPSAKPKSDVVKALVWMDAGSTDEEDASAGDAKGVCSDDCDNDLCVGRTECGQAKVCAELEGECSARFPNCENAQEYCDLRDELCYPISGACREVGDCPMLGKSLRVTVDCKNLRCELRPVSQPFAPSGSAIPLAPDGPRKSFGLAQAAEFDTSEQIQFSYETERPHFLLVRTKPPEDATTDFTGDAIWGLARRAASGPAARRSARWSEGHRIEAGSWHDEPGEPPAGVTLYALVIAVDGDNVVDTSQVLAFRVGSPFPGPGTACTRSLNINDRRRGEPLEEECFHPSIAMTCVNAACREICVGSDGCAWPDKCSVVPEVGIRVCTPPPT